MKDPDLMNAYCWACECNLATLEELERLRSSSKRRIQRQKSICDKMIGLVAVRLNLNFSEINEIVTRGRNGRSYPRIAERLGISAD